jgi:hypothetical protein
MTNAADDTILKWLRPIALSGVESFDVRIDPALRVDDTTAHLLEQDVGTLLTEVTPFMTSHYDAPLTAEVVQEREGSTYILIRAATGDETRDLLATEDDAEPEFAGRTITWQESLNSEPIREPAVHLWCGEVLLKSGEGEAGPFYTLQMAAEAWAFSTALRKPAGEVCAAQVVSYLCARSVTQQLVAGDDSEFRRLSRFWSAPVRSGSVDDVRLPWQRRRLTPYPRPSG